MTIKGRFLVNEHGDLYFLLHNFAALIILFMLKKLIEICWDRLKDIAESVQKPLVNHANCDLENRDLRSVLSHCRLKELHCPIKFQRRNLHD